MTLPGEGDIINIYGQDFREIRAYATTLAGQMFFKNIEWGDLPAVDIYPEREPTVYIGKFQFEQEGVIKLSDALMISPVQLRNVQRETNYCVLDVLRALYHDIRTLAPKLLSPQRLRREKVKLELELENIAE